MSSEVEDESFGAVLRRYRMQTRSRHTGQALTQTEFAQEINKRLGLYRTRNVVGYWETNKMTLHPQRDRPMLLVILAVLAANQGLHSVEEANRLLTAGKYQSLTPEEVGGLGFEHNAIPAAGPVPEPDRLPAPFRSALISILATLPDAALRGSAGSTLERLLAAQYSQPPAAEIELYSGDCGDTPVNLADQRLLVSTAFGAYFTGLLEQPGLYLDLQSQVDCPALPGQAGLQPIQRLFWLFSYPKGPRTVIIGGEGGMGKSTLSAKIIRCLYQERAVDLILGDSAKSRRVDPLSGEIISSSAGYDDLKSFFARMCSQLGLPPLPKGQALGAIGDRLLGRKAIIVVDNLETVERGAELLDSLKLLTSRDVRAIVTTRHVHGLRSLERDRLVVQLQPLRDLHLARKFLSWHVERYSPQHPALQRLQLDLDQDKNIAWLVERTGGIPLLMQLVLSNVARYSWDFMRGLPSLFGPELLDFLYASHWDELGTSKPTGQVARQLLAWIAQEQYGSQPLTSARLAAWAQENGVAADLPGALSVLYERFLIINRDVQVGNFSIYPSLADFVGRQAK